MQETAKAFQELIITLQKYWYFGFVYIWWVATTVLYFKENKLRKYDKPPFNWIVYLIVLGTLLALFYGNRVAFNTLFTGGIKILIVVFFSLKNLIFIFKNLIVHIFQSLPSVLASILSILSSIILNLPFKIRVILPTIIKITVILLIVIAAKYRHQILNIVKKILIIIGIIAGIIIGLFGAWCWFCFCFVMFGIIVVVPIAFMFEVLQIDLRGLDLTRWFNWVEFDYLIPLIALFFYPATDFTLNFLVESFTRHPLEGTLTVKTSRKTWLFIIGLLILLTGIIGKILGKVR